MSELISVTTLGICHLVGYAALGIYSRSDSAISSEAQAAQYAAFTVVEPFERSQALFGDRAAAISQLRTLANDCAENGWDGSDAKAIDPLALFMAEQFVRALPEQFPLPEFAPEPDGSISLDWIQSRNRLFSISIGSNNRLAYAWLDGTDKGHGVARFEGERIPRRVIAGICEITDHGSTT